MKSYRLLLIAGLLILLMAVIPAAMAQDDVPPTPVPPAPGQVTDDEVNAIADDLYCPVCENVPLDVCSTQACADWREEIRTMLGEGRDPDYIQDYFADRYGRRVLATPRLSGADIIVWVAPVLAVLAGLGVLIAALRRMAPEALTETIAPAAALQYEGLDPETVARVEAELAEFSDSLE